MDLTPRMQKYIDDRLVEAGAQWNRPFSWPHIQMVAICDSASPEAFHGEVRMAGAAIIITSPTDDLGKAFRDAEQAFTARLIGLFQN